MPASPETVAVVLAAEADRDLHPVTITMRAATIAARAPRPGPARPVPVAGHRGSSGRDPASARVRPQRRAQALELGPLARIVELVALDAEDLCFEPVRGLLVSVRRSKTDQPQQGELVAVPYAQQPALAADPTALPSACEGQSGSRATLEIRFPRLARLLHLFGLLAIHFAPPRPRGHGELPHRPRGSRTPRTRGWTQRPRNGLHPSPGRRGNRRRPPALRLPGERSG
jgi:hypothetical protein